MKNFNFLKMSTIGVIPLLMAVDCLSSAALYSVLYFAAMSVSSVSLYALKGFNYRGKYLFAVLTAFSFNYFIYSALLAGKYCAGGSPQLFVFISSISVAGIYFDYEFKHFNGFIDFLKYFFIVAASGMIIFFTYGFLIYIFNDRLGHKITFFSYPCSAVITSAVCALLISRLLKKII
ncbi:MAG TPA: hypothetical protein PKW98_11350 [Candidatus Wallbacteria bacterium]|nr:MAG: hypothetical protein BWY32_02773 [bacterium ADurb.Bin243]HPG58402.1 hypothetical protein [Candidatus Wallbacteria bacterium]